MGWRNAPPRSGVVPAVNAPLSDLPDGADVLKTTTSVCPDCLSKVPATVRRDGTDIVLDKVCPTHGRSVELLESDSDFYFEADASGGACGPGGCLFSHSCTLIFEITERCNLTCPTCFTASSPEEEYFLPFERFVTQLDWLLEHGKRDADILQLSGGEPTIHPDLERMIEHALERGIGKIYINTNGVVLGKSSELADRLSRFSDRLQLYLQFDGFRASTYASIRGADGLLTVKKRALEHAASARLYTLPVVTVTRGVNDDEVGAVLRLAMQRHPHCNTVMLQPAMRAGRYLGDRRERRMTTGDVVAAVEEQTGGLFTRADFGPIPCSHPNCFLLAVAVVRDGQLVPISRYFPRYETWSDPTVATRIARFTDRMPQNLLEVLAQDALVDELLDLLADGEDTIDWSDYRNFFLIGIKPFMDEHTYDQDRVDRCCTHVVDRSGMPVSLCEYNTLRRPRGLV